MTASISQRRFPARSLVLWWFAPLAAWSFEDPSRFPTISAFHGTWLDTSFVDAVPRFAKGTLRRQSSYFWSAAVSDDLTPKFRLGIPWIDPWLGRFDWEVQGLKHYGLQDHYEVSAAVILHTADLVLGDTVAVNIGVGEGGSYAFGGAAYEKGEHRVRGRDLVEFQNHLIYEAEWSFVRWPQVRIPLRIHHRSGAWGVISPQATGSNFFAMGIRIGF